MTANLIAAKIIECQEPPLKPVANAELAEMQAESPGPPYDFRTVELSDFEQCDSAEKKPGPAFDTGQATIPESSHDSGDMAAITPMIPDVTQTQTDAIILASLKAQMPHRKNLLQGAKIAICGDSLTLAVSKVNRHPAVVGELVNKVNVITENRYSVEVV